MDNLNVTMNTPVFQSPDQSAQSQAEKSSLFASARAVGLVVALLAALTYLPAVRNDFVDWDDTICVTRNPHVKAGLNPSGIAYAWTTFDSNNWIPLTWLSYELDSTLFGLNPAAFHATNILLHTLNAWLLFRVLRQFTGSLYRSAVVAALFSVHPLHVESVAWVSERKDVLSTCGLLLTLLAYRRYALRPTRVRFALVFCTMALGLLAKSMLVTLPLLLCLVDYWPLQRITLTSGEEPAPDDYLRTPWQLLVEKIPLLILALADGLVTLAAQRTAMTLAENVPFHVRLGNAVVACGWYLWKTIWPTELYTFYHHPQESLSPVIVVACGGLLMGISIYVFVRGRRHKYLMFGWLWFLISLLPVIGLVQVGMQAYADRYSYVPHIGLLIALAWGTSEYLCADRSMGKNASQLPAHRLTGALLNRKSIGFGLAIGAIGACIPLTLFQIDTWRSTDTLWRQALRFDPYNSVANLRLAERSARREDWDAALEYYSNVLVDIPTSPDAILYLGVIHQRRQEWAEAAEYYQWMLRLQPGYPVATQKLASLPPRRSAAVRRLPAVIELTRQGITQVQRGDLQAAADSFQAAADSDPQDVFSQNNAARILEKLNRPELAQRYYQRALSAKSGDPEAHHGIDRIEKRKAIRR